MGRGGGEDKPGSLEALGVSKEEINRLTLIKQNDDLASITEYLVRSTNIINKALGREGKAKGNPVELAASLYSLVDTISGLCKYNESRLKEVYDLLTDAGIQERDAFSAAVEARYILKAYSPESVKAVSKAKYKEEKPEEPNKKAKKKK